MGPLVSFHPGVKIGVLMVHANKRDGDQYYCIIDAAVRLGITNRESAFIIAPQFRTPGDDPPQGWIWSIKKTLSLMQCGCAGQFYWDYNNGWKAGDESTSDMTIRVSSFHILRNWVSWWLQYLFAFWLSLNILDEIVHTFCNKTLFPSLEKILVVGHSAGGQTVQRYALGTMADSFPGKVVAIKYIIANPSSFLYLDATRARNISRNPTCGRYCNSTSIPSDTFTFGLPTSEDITSCKNYNLYKYGTDNLNKYMNKTGVSTLVHNYRQKNVTYLFGGEDTCNSLYDCDCSDHVLDTTCSAQLQGMCRIQRGWIYYKYLQHVYNTDYSSPVHQAFTIANVGHDACEMFSRSESLRVLFGWLNQGSS